MTGVCTCLGRGYLAAMRCAGGQAATVGLQSCPNICAAGSHPLVFLCFAGHSSSSFHAGKHARLRLLPSCPLCLQAASLLQPCPISLSWQLWGTIPPV